MDESWTLVINLAKTDTYILVQKSMLHLFPLISARRLNPQTHEHTNTRTNEHFWFIILMITAAQYEGHHDRSP